MSKIALSADTIEKMRVALTEAKKVCEEVIGSLDGPDKHATADAIPEVAEQFFKVLNATK